MFTSIHLENYKTFSNITIDLVQKNGAPKNLALFYGENGAGKSNFATVFYTLAETIRTMDIRDFLEDFMARNRKLAENESVSKMLREHFRDMEAIIQDVRTIGAPGNLVLDFSFCIDEKKGRYLLEMDDKEIVRERLEYILEKNKGLFFDITPSSRKLNDKVFINKAFLTDLQSNLTKFWGKHSLLAILYHETEDKARSYLDGAISNNFRVFLEDFRMLSCKVKTAHAPSRGVVGLIHPMLSELENGEIKAEKVGELNKTELMLNHFLPQLNRDIEKVYYKRKEKDNVILYELYTKQLISGVLTDIPFSKESTGTHAILDLLPFFLNAASGATVVIDELDTGIHDLRVRDLLMAVSSEISGQLIITTHNTLLMDSKLAPSTFYIIKKEEKGQRKVACITQLGERVHPNHNIQSRYLAGEYEGTPTKMTISLKELLSDLDFSQ